jgi:hypothetical protein
MAGYVEKEIARQQRILSDAVAGKGLQKAIKALQDKSQIKDSLKTLPARGDIVAKRKNAKRTAGTSGGYTETARSYYATVRELRSSDGLFLLQFKNVDTITMSGTAFKYLDFDPSTML